MGRQCLSESDIIDGRQDKWRTLRRCMRQRGLSGAEVLYIDDSPQETEVAKRCCMAMQCRSRSGLAAPDFGVLRQLAHSAREAVALGRDNFAPPTRQKAASRSPPPGSASVRQAAATRF
eukprot:TRINITY_DN57468_c0_g1_i2.p3 TRINITY_DN57468_c0_g1~~TRINITY_DN57468_c0_g1_i2.p3  ORF type:complete len:119 (+),score=16.12 TRINITY_DN57468_c0_g1_i2:1015-1371(+)